ncbi:MAG: hypothetical protein HYX28_09545 [Candidatus Koribacter versatilis]|uniref:Peptidase family M49 n=1 Tax=Candidatus Korobacter versatilis TaxID=658062 RepID=A0A932A9D5_9BACT|nr:hypothetical protein [Candidatus Koribacter versatilis]
MTKLIRTTAALLLFTLSAAAGFAQKPAAKKTTKKAPSAAPAQPPTPSIAELGKMTARFAPTPIVVSTADLSAGDQQALVKLIQAAAILNHVFMDQLWSGDRDVFANLQKDKSALGRARLHYFWLNKGPWSDLDHGKAFLPDVPAEKPAGANFYPEDMTRQDFEMWVETLAPKEQEAAKGFFTVIRRAPDRNLQAIPFSEQYKEGLDRAAALLREAAGLTSNDSLKKFLTARADAFHSNDYYASDVAWMDLDAPLDVTIGPYETYNDELFGYKAACEAYVNLRDEKETAKLGFFGQHLQEIEGHLPIEPKYRNPKLGAMSPIRVVNEVFAAGDGGHGVQTAAYNLPNDERVVAEKGAKRVMLKNVQEAKFKQILLPIAKQVLTPEEQKSLSFDAFFTHILAHELTHGLGPQQIELNGRKTTPRAEMKEVYGAIEEAKADVTGLFALQYLLDQQAAGKIPMGTIAISERQLYTTYFASMFRTMRFGTKEAHGRGMAMQFNYLLGKGAVVVGKTGAFGLDWQKVKPAFRDLDHDLLTLEATGNYAGAKSLLETKAVVGPGLERALARLAAIPTDIEPVFVTAKKLVPQVVASGADFEKK